MGARRWVVSFLVFVSVAVGGALAWVAPAGAVVSQFGSFGEEAGQFSEAQSVAVDQASGEVYILDTLNDRVDVFTSEGVFVMAWGEGVADGVTRAPQTCTTACFQGISAREVAGKQALSESGAGELGEDPIGVAVDNDPLSPSYQDVYVPEGGNHRVEKFSASGSFVSMFGKGVNENGTNVCVAGEKCQAGVEGSGDGEFNSFKGAVAVGPTGNVFVGDHERAQEFSPEGVFLASFPVESGYTSSIALDAAGDFYVIGYEGGANGVFEYDASGTVVRVLDSTGDPLAVTVDSSGNVYVGNRTGVLEYAPSGEELASFDQARPTEDGNKGIAFGETTGRLYMPGRPNGSIESEVVRVLAAPAAGPQIEGESTSGVDPQSVTLNALIDPENNDTTYHFEYGATSSYGSSVPSPDEDIGSGFEDRAVSTPVAGLEVGTTYHYRVVASDSKGHVAYGQDQTFTTLPTLQVDSEYATNVASSSATIGGELNPLGVEGAYRIEYDTSEYTQGGPAHGTVVSEGSLGSIMGDVPVSSHINTLTPGTLYHYRIVASDIRSGVPHTIYGSDRTFLTQAAKSVSALPDGRQWEQVSPVDKQGASLQLSVNYLHQASADGGRVSYVGNEPIEAEPQGNRSLELVQLMSVRGANGWSTRDIDTPNETIGHFHVSHFSEYRLFSTDLSSAMLEPLSESALPPLPKDAERTLYIRNDSTGQYDPLVTVDNVVPGAKFGGNVKDEGLIEFEDATPDFSHVVFLSPAALTPGAVEKGGNNSLYEWFDGRLTLVSVLPDGESGSQQGSAAIGYGNTTRRHAVSDDGSRVIWSDGPHLYLRDTTRGEAAPGATVQVDAPQGITGRQTEGGEVQFDTADSSGSRVFFTSQARLTADSTASEDPDLYVFEVASSPGAPLAGRLTDLTVEHNTGESANVQGVIGASEDGTSVFFAADGLLGDATGDVPGATYLYADRYDTQSKAWSGPHLIAALAGGEDKPSWGATPTGPSTLFRIASRVSPDGRFLAFMSSRSLTGYDNRDATSGEPDEELFLYDASTGRLSCSSCSPAGARPDGVFAKGLNSVSSPLLLTDFKGLWNERWLAVSTPEWVDSGDELSFYQPRYLFDNGRLFFNSPDALVPGDTNGTWDVYEFEPEGVGDCTTGSSTFHADRGGCVGLISSGGSREESAFMDASETGDDAFFLTSAGLAPRDGDGLLDVYDAHVCSLAAPCPPAAAVSAPPCSTSDSCKAAPTPQPASFGAPSSQTFSGAGNIQTGSSMPIVRQTRSLTRGQKLARALKACMKKHGGRSRSLCKRRARRRYGTAARAKRSRTNDMSLPVRAGR